MTWDIMSSMIESRFFSLESVVSRVCYSLVCEKKTVLILCIYGAVKIHFRIKWYTILQYTCNCIWLTILLALLQHVLHTVLSL